MLCPHLHNTQRINHPLYLDHELPKLRNAYLNQVASTWSKRVPQGTLLYPTKPNLPCQVPKHSLAARACGSKVSAALIIMEVLLRLRRGRARELATRLAGSRLTLPTRSTEQPTAALAIATTGSACWLARAARSAHSHTALSDNAIEPIAALVAASGKAAHAASPRALRLVGADGQAVALAEAAGLLAAEAGAAGVLAGCALLALALAGLQGKRESESEEVCR